MYATYTEIFFFTLSDVAHTHTHTHMILWLTTFLHYRSLTFCHVFFTGWDSLFRSPGIYSNPECYVLAMYIAHEICMYVWLHKRADAHHKGGTWCCQKSTQAIVVNSRKQDVTTMDKQYLGGHPLRWESTWRMSTTLEQCTPMMDDDETRSELVCFGYSSREQ